MAMKPETKAKLDELYDIAKGINISVENTAISEIPCELHSFYKDANDRIVTDKIISSTLTKLIIKGLCSELSMIEVYIDSSRVREGIDDETAEEILNYVKTIRGKI